MRILNTSPITDSNGMPVKSGSLQHIQDAAKEAIAQVVISRLVTYDPAATYILHGCVNSGSGQNFNISTGAVFFNGEIFLVDAASFIAAAGQTAIGNIVTTQFAAPNADPVLFTDGQSRNVHDIRKMVFSSGLAGSGTCVFNDMKSAAPDVMIGEIKFVKMSTAEITLHFNMTPGPTMGLGISNRFKGWAIRNGNNGTRDAGGAVIVAYKPSDSDFDDLGATGGAKTVSLTADQNGPHTHSYKIGTLLSNDDGGGTPDYVGQGDSQTGSSGLGSPHENMPPYIVELSIERIA